MHGKLQFVKRETPALTERGGSKKVAPPSFGIDTVTLLVLKKREIAGEKRGSEGAPLHSDPWVRAKKWASAGPVQRGQGLCHHAPTGDKKRHPTPKPVAVGTDEKGNGTVERLLEACFLVGIGFWELNESRGAEGKKSLEILGGEKEGRILRYKKALEGGIPTRG